MRLANLTLTRSVGNGSRASRGCNMNPNIKAMMIIFLSYALSSMGVAGSFFYGEEDNKVFM
jgi:hypothetical protein